MEPLSGLDAFFLYAETESMHMHVAMTAVLDPTDMPEGYSYARIRDHIESRLHLIPPFTRKLVTVPMQLHHPYWIEDQNFRLINHLRQVTLPQPGGPEDLGRMCGEIASVPLVRSRPLWEMWVIDGLYDGNVALLAKVHHSCVDGVSGVDLLTSLFDLDRDAEPLEPPARLPVEQAPVETTMMRDAVAQRVRVTREIGGLVKRTASGLNTVRRLRKNPHVDAGGTPTRAPRTSFNGKLTPNRNVAFAHLALDEIKAVKSRLECKVNDVILTVCAGTLRRYLLSRDELPDDPLLASCPVSVRPDNERDEQNNKVSAIFAQLRTDIEDPVERLLAMQRTTNAAKREHELVGDTMLTEWADVLDPTLLSLGAKAYTRSGLADRHRPIHNLVISNVPGPDFPIYLAGAQLVRAYPMGPTMEGSGLNITVMSYMNSVDFGFMVCDELIPEVWDLADFVAPAFEALKVAVLADDTPAAEATAETGTETAAPVT